MPEIRQKITPFLWFNDQAEEAARFYTSLFDDSRVVDIARYTAANPRQEGSVMLVTFELAGQRFYALNGGPDDPFNKSVSLLVDARRRKRSTRFGASSPMAAPKDPAVG
jgi:predicted 3-demethylubiquinone-9 3-methyltransferase (glyoxalase superfamily)